MNDVRRPERPPCLHGARSGREPTVIFVVLGMHKSGTTLVSQILHHSGIDMGDFDEGVSYDKGNKYERESCLALDMDILGTSTYDVLDLAAPADPALTDVQRARMRGIIDECSRKHGTWGFKDPRAALIYDLWATELPEHRLIVVYRDPAEVWPRFKWHGLRKHLANFAYAGQYLLRWQEHNRSILRSLESSSRDRLVIYYKDLMSGDGEFARLEAFVGRKLIDRRKPGLYRSKGRGDVFLRVAEWWLQLTRGLSTSRTMEELDALRRR